MLLDTHHHFDFLSSNQLKKQFLSALADEDVRIVAQTLTPSSFFDLLGQRDELATAGAPLPLWSVGYHPWFVTETAVDEELNLFAAALHHTRFVGEIGLDFSPHRVAAVDETLQRRALQQALKHVCRAAADTSVAEPFVLSLHAVRSADVVLTSLEQLAAPRGTVVPVLHRFSGTSDDVTRLIRLGGYLSVHPHVLTTKRGRAYVRQVPAERLLLETDLPSATVTQSREGIAQDLLDELTASIGTSLAVLSEIRDCDMTPVIQHTQKRLYGVE